MRTFSFPSWSKDFEDRVNATGGAGMPGIVQHFELFDRAGVLASAGDFLSDLTALVEGHEVRLRERQSLAERLKGLKYPKLTGKDWKAQLHAWMQEIYDAFLGSRVEVPAPPDLNRAGRRLLTKYGMRLLFVPNESEEHRYPSPIVAPRNLIFGKVERIPLPGKWVAFEMIHMTADRDGRYQYPNDRLLAVIGLDTRVTALTLGQGGGDEFLEGILSRVTQILAPLGGTVRLPSGECFIWIAQLFDWLGRNTSDSCVQFLGSDLMEWCENRCGSRHAFIECTPIISCDSGTWLDKQYPGMTKDVGCRFLVQF